MCVALVRAARPSLYSYYCSVLYVHKIRIQSAVAVLLSLIVIVMILLIVCSTLQYVYATDDPFLSFPFF